MFRKDAIDNRKMNWRGQAILLPGIPLWMIITGCLIFTVGFVTFITAGTYTRRINVSGEITTLPRPANIYSGVQGIVTHQYVHEGDLIKKGDPLYQIDVSKSTSSGIVSENKKRDIQSQLKRVDDIIDRLTSSKKVTLDSLKHQKIQYLDAFTLSSDIIKRAEEGIKLMKDNMNNYRHYHEKGLITKDQLTYQETLYYQQQNNLLSLSGQKDQNSLQLTSLDSQIQTQAADFDNRIFQMELQQYDLRKELLDADQSGTIIIRSFSEGKIDSLSVSLGQMVNGGDSLLQIIPANIKRFYLVAWVPNDAIPYISKDDFVNVRYEAFPAEKFGQFSAKVLTTSRTPASRQEMLTYQGAPESSPENAGPWFKIIISPDKQAIDYVGKSLPLENGMKANVTLFLETRKIYQWMLSPFYDMKNSATGQVNAK